MYMNTGHIRILVCFGKKCDVLQVMAENPEKAPLQGAGTGPDAPPTYNESLNPQYNSAPYPVPPPAASPYPTQPGAYPPPLYPSQPPPQYPKDAPPNAPPYPAPGYSGNAATYPTVQYQHPPNVTYAQSSNTTVLVGQPGPGATVVYQAMTYPDNTCAIVLSCFVFFCCCCCFGLAAFVLASESQSTHNKPDVTSRIVHVYLLFSVGVTSGTEVEARRKLSRSYSFSVAGIVTGIGLITLRVFLSMSEHHNSY